MNFALKRLLKDPNTIVGMESRWDKVIKYKTAIDRKWITEVMIENVDEKP